MVEKLLPILDILPSFDDIEKKEIDFIVFNAKCDLKEKLKICERIGNFDYLSPKIIESLKPEIIYDKALFTNELFNHSNPSNILEDCFDDAISGLKDYKKYQAIYGLSEAIYGLTSDNTVVAYAISPILTEPVNLQCYFELWKNMVKYIVTKDNNLLIFQPVSCPNCPPISPLIFKLFF